MMKTDDFLPEGSYGTLPSVRQALHSLEGLRRAQDEGRILEAPALRCTAAHDLLFDFGFARGVMPRACCALGIAEGQVREIAVLSRVGKPTCFVVTDIDEESEPPTVWLSRTAVQLRAQEALLSSLSPGDIIPAAVTHLEPFGAFVDIGCGLPSLIGIENLSVSRIYHPSDRLTVGQSIRAAVRSVDVENRRITLTHRELLGTWEERCSAVCRGRDCTRHRPLGRTLRRVYRAGAQSFRARGKPRGSDARHAGFGLHQIHPAAANEDQAERDRYSAAYRYARAAALFCLRRPYRPLGLYPGRLRQEIHRDRILLNGSR